ncbi:hypothetical protein [Streptomyces sp. V1I1]|uniref:hypothetical protein n=1 Tax=Streptomyces sp. V1I1 TaxID=3042272 RepID=UPI0027849B58|nr:hypothetical protein [Streptomyces sp. V1I1]MDQ0938313.1 Rho GDP-dissociation inhibitor [Streptomyces sp. V1I1]
MEWPPDDAPAAPPASVLLLGLTLQVGYEETAIPLLPADRQAGVPVLKEGTECRTDLKFSVAGDAVQGLKVVDVRWKEGTEVARREVFLGDFRVGGPYEVALPPERMPSGSVAQGLYEVRTTLIDVQRHILGEQTYSFEIKRLMP